MHQIIAPNLKTKFNFFKERAQRLNCRNKIIKLWKPDADEIMSLA